LQSVSVNAQRTSDMSDLASVHSRASVAALSTSCWPCGIFFATRFWRALFRGFLSSYRPELHYMRGPGPRWREKHDLLPSRVGDGGRPQRFIRGDAESAVPEAGVQAEMNQRMPAQWPEHREATRCMSRNTGTRAVVARERDPGEAREIAE